MNDSTRGSDPLAKPGTTGTRVDLGEDLLAEPTGAPVRSASPESTRTSSSSETHDDQLDSARILFREGMLEEAKKELHQIIIAQGDYFPARKLLDEIHEQELKQIFRYEAPRRRQSDGAAAWHDPRKVDTQAIMEKLDDDLKLGMSAPEVSLLQDTDGKNLLCEQLDQALSGAAPQDRIDMGIAFLEMGLFEISSRIFRVAARVSSGEQARSATALLAYSLILGGQAFEATIVIAPSLQDVETTDEGKLEFMYLMGRAHEALKKPAQAIAWYRQAREIEPRYRDSEERIVRLGQ